MFDVEFIFGGSFDPIHDGHLHILKNLMLVCPQCPIRIIPCSIPALKQPTSATFQQRVEMIRIAVGKNKRIIIDTREVDRAGKSYTHDTLIELQADYPKRHFVLVIGSDNLESIGQWYQAEKLANYCHLMIVNRPHSRVEDYINTLKLIGFHQAPEVMELQVQKSGLFYCLRMSEKESSSTAIRDELKGIKETKMANKSGSKIEKQDQQETDLTMLAIDIPVVVRQYIKKHSIYL